MIQVKKCCFCFTPKTGTAILGCIGIILGVFAMVPHVLLLQNHDFYIREFVRQERLLGERDISDNDVPLLTQFSKVFWASFVAFDVILTFASILTLAAVSADRRYLLIPWLIVVFFSVIFCLIMVLSYMFKVANEQAFTVLFISAPFFVCTVYFWLTVHSTFRQMTNSISLPRGDGGPLPDVVEVGTDKAGRRYQSLRSVGGNGQDKSSTTSLKKQVSLITQSASMSSSLGTRPSLASDGSPPPPYDVVAMAVDESETEFNTTSKSDAESSRRSKSVDNFMVAILDSKSKTTIHHKLTPD